MRRAKKIFLFILICCNILFVSAQNITIDDSYTAQELVENVLVKSSCALVSASLASGDIVPIGKNSYGYFTNGGGIFPFKEGVLLSTWSATNSKGPYVFFRGDGNDSSWPGDSDLNQALTITSTNATILEFDFVPLTNFLSFDYVFASNEYKDESPCQYSDGFAFLLKENVPGATYKNLAVLPGTTTPVSSFSVHPTTPLGSCLALNANYYNGNNTFSSPINYAGQTVVMNAQSAVIAGKSYHIKLVIADDKNQYYDSAVLLNAGSFAPKIDIGSDRVAPNNPICFGEIFTIETQLPNTYSYKWFKDSIEILGETKPSLNVTDSGNYKVEVIFTPATCMASDEIRIEYTPEIVLTNTALTQCDDNNDGVSIFNLSRADTIIKNNDSTLSPVVYYESLLDAQNKINPITNPSTYTNKITVPILFARVSTTFGCANYAQLNLKIATNSISAQSPVTTCDDDSVQDGFYQFDLNAQITPQILNRLPTGLNVEYYVSTTDAIAQKNPLPNIFKNTTANQQIIQARIINGSDCFGIIPITLNVNLFNPTDFETETTSLCIGFTGHLRVASGFSGYLWSTGETTEQISVQSAGNYSVTVTGSSGCKAVKNFRVLSSEKATITNAMVTDFAGNINSVQLIYTGSGIYEFSLDGINFQNDSLFTNIAPGKYFGYANDKNGCGLSYPFEVYVMDYPRFFTPNADGYNDNWTIKNLELFPKATLTIFNRFGKLLYEINTLNKSWDGKHNGSDLPSDDYWFTLHFDNEKIIKGHFSLKK